MSSARMTADASEVHGQTAESERFASLVGDALRDAAGDAGLSEGQARAVLYRMLQAGLVQERRAPSARRELARALGPAMADLDPVPAATVEQARRLAALRSSLLRQGAWSTAAIADARAMSPNAVRQWISRHRKAFRIFTVSHEGETLVPAFLLDDAMDPRPEAQEPIRVLRESGEDGWALWAWFATPSAWTGGDVPAELLAADPARVATSARQRATSAM